MNAIANTTTSRPVSRRNRLVGSLIALFVGVAIAASPMSEAHADTNLVASCNTQYGFISTGLPHYTAGYSGYHVLTLWYSDGYQWRKYSSVTTTLSNGQWYKNGGWYTNAQTWLYVPARGVAYLTSEYLVVNGRVVMNAYDRTYEGFNVSSDWLSTMNGGSWYCQM